jgi:hypothetical protein
MKNSCRERRFAESDVSIGMTRTKPKVNPETAAFANEKHPVMRLLGLL